MNKRKTTMSAIPNLSKLALIETEPTGVGSPKQTRMVDGSSELPYLADAGPMILQILVMLYDGPKKVCIGLRDMMRFPGLRSKNPIVKLLGERLKDPEVQEHIWRIAFLKYFGLETTPPDPPIKESRLTLGSTWAQVFDRMCLELGFFGRAQTQYTSIKLDWKNNPSWTPYESDEMLHWLIRQEPFEEEFAALNRGQGHFDSFTMQTVLQLRGASAERRMQRDWDNSLVFNDLQNERFSKVWKLAERVPKIDIDLSPPVAFGTLHNDQELYQSVIAMLTVQMLNNGIVSSQQARMGEYQMMMEMLIKNFRASPDMPSATPQKYVPLCEAINLGEHVTVLYMLLDLGASTEPDLPSQHTPLMFACELDRRYSVSALLRLGANVNASSNGGQTPLSVACQHCKSVDLVEFLLVKRADPAPHKRSPGAIDPMLAPEAILKQKEVEEALRANATLIVSLLNEYRADPHWA